MATRQATVGFGAVPEYVPVRMRLDTITHASDRANASYKEAIKSKNAMKAALAQVNLNAKEDEWKYNYLQKHLANIDEAAQFGDYAMAYQTAINEATDAATSQELLGRVRANAEYQKAMDTADKLAQSGQITELARMRYKDENQYHYEDQYDDQGNIVSGTDWKPNRELVRKVDYASIIAQGVQLTATQSNSSSGTTTTNTPGKLSNSEDLKSDNSVTISHSGSTATQIKDAKKIKETYQSLFRSNPDAEAYMNQDYDDRVWYANKLAQELDKLNPNDPSYTAKAQEAQRLADDVKLDETGIYGWAMKQVDPAIKNAAFKNVQTTDNNSFITQTATSGSSRGGQYGGFGSVDEYINGNDGWYYGPRVIQTVGVDLTAIHNFTKSILDFDMSKIKFVSTEE